MGAELKGLCISHNRSGGHEESKGKRRERAKVTALLLLWHYWSEPHTQVISVSHCIFVKQMIDWAGQGIFISNRKFIEFVKSRNSGKLLSGLFCSLASVSVACSLVRCFEALGASTRGSAWNQFIFPSSWIGPTESRASRLFGLLEAKSIGCYGARDPGNPQMCC